MTGYLSEDTIAAIATAPGEASLAVVRLSGREAISIADRVFRGSRPLRDALTHTLHHGWIVIAAPDGEPPSGVRLDEVVAALFRAPRSYTREDVVELSCHGGRIPARRVLDALLEAGARLAAPGEFSLRAFRSGRIDLAQAEAVVDLVRAETEAAHALALAQLAGALSTRLHSIAERLTDVLAEVEARVDFAEDVGGIEVPPQVIESLAAAGADLHDLLEHAAYARAVREGARVPIVGRPNVGKSSLFNALLGEDRALVTNVPGTTRDRVSEGVDIDGIRVTLSDTAGMRPGAEPIEAMGIARAEEVLASSPAAIWVVDASRPLEPGDALVAERLGGKHAVLALNQIDRGEVVSAAALEAIGAGSRRHVRVSALRGDGLGDLRVALLESLGGATSSAALGSAVSNARHVEALGRARAALERAEALGREGAPGEIVAVEVRDGLLAIGEVTGQAVGEDLLDRIFSRFCIGK